MIHKQGIEPDLALEAATIPEADRKNLGRILNDRLVTEFVKTTKPIMTPQLRPSSAFSKKKACPFPTRWPVFILNTKSAACNRLRCTTSSSTPNCRGSDELHAR